LFLLDLLYHIFGTFYSEKWAELVLKYGRRGGESVGRGSGRRSCDRGIALTIVLLMSIIARVEPKKEAEMGRIIEMGKRVIIRLSGPVDVIRDQEVIDNRNKTNLKNESFRDSMSLQCGDICPLKDTGKIPCYIRDKELRDETRYNCEALNSVLCDTKSSYPPPLFEVVTDAEYFNVDGVKDCLGDENFEDGLICLIRIFEKAPFVNVKRQMAELSAERSRS